MKYNKVIIAMAAMLFICLVVIINLDIKIKQQNIELNNLWRACKDVTEYCDSTADTGEMDDFIQSNEGQEFWAIVKQ